MRSENENTSKHQAIDKLIEHEYHYFWSKAINTNDKQKEIYHQIKNVEKQLKIVELKKYKLL